MNSFTSIFKDFQGFFLDFQNTLFPEQLFMAHSLERVPNTPYVMNTPLYCPPCFTILSNPSSPLPPAFTFTANFYVLFLWLNGWSSHIWCVILLNDIINIYMLSLGTLVPERPCCLLCSKARILLRYDT